ncbi:hypothetical protein NDU88_001723 [Pleurodeles waltl]|uniref:Uncharacterized protein n=1 Tax=Pleurodeles waltl TaxID=8319 RepID=A0AAV7P7Y1_PLEWA|nr:hypothetical protein NDU88_001723 [Pleurodeles waltl]
MGAAGGHPPYHCHAVPPRANKVSPPFIGVPWVLSTDNSDGRPEGFPLAQGPSSWAGAVLPPPIRGTSRPGRSPSALQGSRCVPRPAGHRGASSSIVSVWAPRAALSVQGPSPEPGRRRPLNPRGSARGAQSQCSPGLPVYFRSGGAPRVPHSGVSAWAPRGGPLTQGLFLRPGQGRLFRPRGSTRGARPSTLQGPRSALSPAPRSQEGQQRRSRISRGDPVPAAILFFFPLGASRAAAADRSLPFATAHLHRLLGIQGSRGESKRHPSLGKTALAMGG